MKNALCSVLFIVCIHLVASAPMSAMTAANAGMQLRPRHESRPAAPAVNAPGQSSQFNFSPASGRDDIVFAAHIPGATLRGSPEPHSIQAEDVKEWIDFMKANGVQRVVSLNDHHEADWFAAPGLTEMCKGHFKVVDNVPMRVWNSWQRISHHIKDAEANGERIVFHCSNGKDRCGRVLASWLVSRYGLSTQDATEMMVKHGRKLGALRSADTQKLARYLEVGYESWRVRAQRFVRFNFASASVRDEIVFAAQSPGFSADNDAEEGSSIEEEDVVEWVEYMKLQGVKRVVSICDDSETARYAGPGLTEMCKSHFKVVDQVPLDAKDAWQRISNHMKEAETMREKIVFHCPDGKDRCGRVLASWLVSRHGLSTSEAAKEVVEHAGESGTERKVDIQRLARFLDAGHEAWRAK